MSVDKLGGLTSRQRDAVTHPRGPILILGGPVTGKTHTLLARVVHLVAEQGVSPDQILVLGATFRGVRAARQALAEAGLADTNAPSVSTFELAALEVLRRNPALAGLEPGFVVWDEGTRRKALAATVRRLGLSVEQWPPARLSQHLAECRGNLRDPAAANGTLANGETHAAIVEGYLNAQRQASAIDPDDLVPRTIRLLEAQPEALAGVRVRWPSVLLDDFQEITRAQYAFLRLLAPPPSADVTVTAAPDEAILGRPGFDPRLLELFRREYQPIVVELDAVPASNELIHQAANRFLTRKPLPVSHPPGAPIYHYTFDNLAAEAGWIGDLTRRLVRERDYLFSDIAILSRTYRLASALAERLHAAAIPFQRMPREPFFLLPPARAVMRRLRLTFHPEEEDVRAGLNFPHPWLDDLTLARLDLLAQRQGLSWLELCRRAAEFPEISPLTRVRLRAWAALVDEDMRSGPRDAPVDTPQVVERLFASLESWRNPFTPDEQQRLRAWVEQRSGGAGEPPSILSEAVVFLQKAIGARRPIAIVAPASVDGVAGAAILEFALKTYLDHPVTVHVVGLAEGPASESVAFNTVPVILGRTTRATLPDAPARKAVVLDMGAHKPPTSLAAQAWWLASTLLAAYERPLAGRLVIFEVKTTGADLERDEIIELSAVSLVDGAVASEPFHRRVRPRRAEVPASAVARHGIRWEDVRDAPGIEVVLPDFLTYVAEAPLIGYDCGASLRFLDRDAGRILNRGFAPPLIDILPLAQRLVGDDKQRRLADLLRRFKRSASRSRSGLSGCRHIAVLLAALAEERVIQIALEALPECLPLVAAGTLSANLPIMETNAAWVDAGARLAARQVNSALWARLVQLLGPDRGWEALQVEGRLRSMGSEQREPDETWREFRQAFGRQIDLFCQAALDRSPGSFLAYAALASSADTFAPEPDRVTLLTMSQMQGHSFPVVFITGAEQGHIPLGNPAPASPAFEMERRLFYVALTRARQHLYLCSTRDRGSGDTALPSQFALELPAPFVRRVEVNAEGTFRIE